MDRISELPDELLLKVLMFLPTKVAASTSVLAKRWEYLWMWLPKLEYDDNDYDVNEYSHSEHKRLRSFIDFNLQLHKAPVIESLRLKFLRGSYVFKHEDIILWVAIAVFRGIRELSLNFLNIFSEPRAKLPSSLYTCKSLVVLKLTEEISVDVPRMAYLPSLKTLFLKCVTYLNEKSLDRLLSRCPVLEHLVVERSEYNECGYYELSIIVPSLLRLILRIHRYISFTRLLINTPSLKCFKIVEYMGEGDSYNDTDDIDNDLDNNYNFEFHDMPKLEEADIHLSYSDIDKFVSSIKYVKRLSLCISVNAEEALYRECINFNNLQHLKLCSCLQNWPKLLLRLLKDSPNLRELEIYISKGHSYVNPVLCLEIQLNLECLFSSLETFKWTGIYGTHQEMDLTKCILRNACCLKTAAILFQPPNELEEEYKLEMMIQELSLSFQGSKTCQLVFN